MTIPYIKYSELVEQYLQPNGFTVETPQAQDFWSEHDRIMVSKNDYKFPLQFREKYFYLQVVVLFKSLEIPVPEEHQKCFDQHMELRTRHKNILLQQETEKPDSNAESKNESNP